MKTNDFYWNIGHDFVNPSGSMQNTSDLMGHHCPKTINYGWYGIPHSLSDKARYFQPMVFKG